ncbi:MAG: alanine--tRNA ligase-related protein [Candidatus Shikimatogenerans bostrichidophilus]|nr:MAG: alanine--tRNA ligase-related protein [Candidatus Shikimatogenerans bostrichidophilus]
MKYKLIKKKFLNFFKKKKHKIFYSSSIINNNKNNPNLMFINSGINKYMDFFFKKKPKYLKIANIQRCIRLNDLNIVGYDNLHHTMFEMLGNWSFGDYSLKKAIKLAWELITKKFKINKKKIYITIFKGDKKRKLDFDYESYNIWKKLVNKDNILFFGFKNNFWKIDNFNLCGPSTEIHINISKNNNKYLVNKSNKIIELWNIVNIKYCIKNNIIYNNKNLLSNNYIDTGMGLERLCMILQKKKSIYNIDFFLPIINKIEKILNIKFNKKNKKNFILIKIITDHIRSIFYSILDGVKPNNKKLGYIIRKLIRRSLIYTYKILKIKKPFLYKIIPTLFKVLYKKKDFSYLKEKNTKKLKKYVINIIKNEEKNFFLILKKNYKIVKNFLKNNLIKDNKNKKKIDKNLIYKIYETYGIYYFLIKKISKKLKLKIDKKKYISKKIEI